MRALHPLLATREKEGREEREERDRRERGERGVVMLVAMLRVRGS